MLTYLLLGFLGFALIGWAQRKRLLRLPTWRLGAAAGAIVTFSGCLYCGLRNLWIPALVLGVIGVWLAVSARLPRMGAASAAPPSRQVQGEMSLSDARATLGVTADATPEEIKAAYSRLMQRVHPDVGGAAGLATQLNLARDRLLKG